MNFSVKNLFRSRAKREPEINARRLQIFDWVNTAVMGAEPGQPFLLRSLELTLKKFADEGEFYRSPAIHTAVLKEMGLRAYGFQEIDGVTQATRPETLPAAR